MVITNSEVSMTSKSSYAQSLKSETATSYTPCLNIGGAAVTQNKTEDTGTGTDFLSTLNYSLGKNGTVQLADEGLPSNSYSSSLHIRVTTISYLLRQLLYSHINGNNMSIQDILADAFNSSNTFLVSTTTSYEYSESQQVDYLATGKAITADGRELEFNYSFSMSESFESYYEESGSFMKTINLVDPLVINLKDSPETISDQKFYFDLDMDGEEEEISQLGEGMGFLAIDLNGDGKINDGSELFGTSTGDGFRELADYDEDGNGWIDEKDSIYSKLRIWTMDETGKSELYGLKESDVGAIYLGKIKTKFTDYDDARDVNAVIQETGIYLHESTGRASAVQHVDFAT